MCKNIKELWRNIEGYLGMYQVSSFGRIRSFKYKLPRVLKPRINKRGYRYINLSDKGSSSSFSVHRIVAIHFLGSSDLTVNHKNGNKLNNCVENLEWISIGDNRKHAKKNNLLATRENNGRSKLKLRDINNIRYKQTRGLGYRKLSKEFGVSRSVIRKIIKNINWN